ncbi:MAG: hypothetical protein LQ339_002211 [Xanthoria mediterranea]|nr:MAG: hypothetical protein LQ339_002211 [Xanthoria mediterranea]
MSEQTVQCPHDGNPDFYGLGIRVGIYLQLTTAIVAKYFHPEAIPENLTANTIFLLALFAAIATATLGSGLRPEEIVILLQLCFGFLLSVLSILGGRPGPDHPKGHATISAPPSIASYLRLTLTMAICAYAVWFWFPGKDEMEISGCASYMFFLTKVSLFGGVRLFYQVQSAIIIIPLAALFTWYSNLLFWCYVSTLIASSTFAHQLARSDSQMGTGWQTIVHLPKIALAVWWTSAHGSNIDGSAQCDKKSWMLRLEDRSNTTFVRCTSRCTIAGSPTIMKLTKPLFPLICFLWTVLSVEFTLSFNRISGVYDIRSTGQLIPFVIGLVRLLSLCHGIILRHADTEAQKIMTVCNM